MNTSDSPRTDALEHALNNAKDGLYHGEAREALVIHSRALERKNARLREALESIAQYDHPEHPIFGDDVPNRPRTEAHVAERMAELARTVLSGAAS